MSDLIAKLTICQSGPLGNVPSDFFLNFDHSISKKSESHSSMLNGGGGVKLHFGGKDTKSLAQKLIALTVRWWTHEKSRTIRSLITVSQAHDQ